MAATEVEKCVDELLAGYTVYDRAVDVVSAFEMIFTESKTPVPATVRHFDRFPKIPGKGDVAPSTPDFTVLFKDGSGIAGEVARIALHDNSVESLCEQLLRYDGLTTLPGAGGKQAKVSHCDVLLLVPWELATAAVARIHEERMGDPNHPYKPSAAPCAVSFGFDQGKWVFDRSSHPLNGRLREKSRQGIQTWFDKESIRSKPSRFAPIKTSRAFINDSVDTLYLATRLWANTFANMASKITTPPPALLTVGTEEITADVLAKFGRVRINDVRRAMEMLATARLAAALPGDTWQVLWEKLLSPEERELERIIARRACNPPSTSRLSASDGRSSVRASCPSRSRCRLSCSQVRSRVRLRLSVSPREMRPQKKGSRSSRRRRVQLAFAVHLGQPPEDPLLGEALVGGALQLPPHVADRVEVVGVEAERGDDLARRHGSLAEQVADHHGRNRLSGCRPKRAIRSSEARSYGRFLGLPFWLSPAARYVARFFARATPAGP